MYNHNINIFVTRELRYCIVDKIYIWEIEVGQTRLYIK